MPESIDYAMLGRKLYAENPQAAGAWQQQINILKAGSLTDTTQIHSFFLHFCQLKEINITEIRYNDSRATNSNVNNRRLFIAVILQMYDPLNINGFTGRKTDRLRQAISDVLNCNEAWISQVWESIHNDLIHLKGYKQETQEIITLLKESTPEHNITPFTNEKRRQQRQMSIFE